MPEWLLWLLPVLLAPLLAVLWTAWAGRSRGPVEAIDSVQAYERFRTAMATPVPAPRRGRTARSRATAASGTADRATG